MPIILIGLGSFLLFGRSKYFPQHLSGFSSIVKKYPNSTRFIAYVLMALSFMVLSMKYGWGTAIALFLMVLIFSILIVVMVLPLHRRLVYVLAFLVFLLLIFDTIS